jgi:hypothetical protein
MSDSRIPDSIAKFNSYINNTDDWLKAISSGVITNRERLTLTAQNGTDWSGYRDDWRDNIYPILSDPATVTTTVKSQARTLRNSFRTFANPLLDIIAACPAAIAMDEKKFNLVLNANRDTTVTHKGKIEDVPIVSIKGIGGGQMKCRVRTTEDASRASMHELADLIEVRYMIGIPNNPGPIPNPSDVPTVELATSSFISKKAIFIMELPPASAGKHLFAFVRWVNASNAQNSGPWTVVILAVIA